MNAKKQYASVFELNGMPKLSQAFPLALQHVVAMIVGCVTPAIVISGVAGLNGTDKVILVQAALFIAAISTLIQLLSAWRKARLRSAGHHGCQLCLSAEYAGNCRQL